MRMKDVPAPVRPHIAGSVLAIEPMTGDNYLVVRATTGDIVSETGTLRTFAWSQFASGTWDGEERTFIADAIDVDIESLNLAFTEDVDPRIGLILSDRIESSIVHTETARVGQAGFVRTLVRRDVDGSLFTQTIGVGVEGADPATVASIATELESSAREAVGMSEN